MSEFGIFVWYELMTSDLAAAERFYGDVVGWTAKDSGMPGLRYTIFEAGSDGIAGAMTLPPEAAAQGARPGWIGYVRVSDVDAFARRVGDAGGRVHKAPEDIPGVGRFAVVADPHGAAFCLFKEAQAMERAAVPPGTEGHIGWHELHAGDGPAAFAFYADLFGWTKGHALPMGDLGVYQLFAAGGPDIGGIMTKMAVTPHPFWLYYVNVDAIDAAAARVTAGGGQILTGPMEVPGPMWVVHCLDPQGVIFAMVAPKR